MKSNVKTIGEVELDELEFRELAFSYVKEDRKLIFLAVQKYLKSTHQYELKKVASSENTEGAIILKCEVESVKSEAPRTLFETKKTIDRSNRKTQEGGHKKNNVGFYTVLMDILSAHRKKSKEPMDAEEVYKDMLFELPKLSWRHFTIYVSDKRRQDSIGFVYKATGRKKTDKKWIYAKK